MCNASSSPQSILRYNIVRKTEPVHYEGVFVQMDTVERAQVVQKAMHMLFFLGRRLQVKPAPDNVWM